mgnify:CR=1 FL=1
MTIHLLPPTSKDMRSFWTAPQLETQATGMGATKELARVEMVRHRKFRANLEDYAEEKKE